MPSFREELDCRDSSSIDLSNPQGEIAAECGDEEVDGASISILETQRRVGTGGGNERRRQRSDGDGVDCGDIKGDGANVSVLQTQRRVGTPGGDERRRQRSDGDGLEDNVVVGFAFMAKKMDSMSKITAVSPCDGVEFHELDFSKPPEQYRRVDVILHKLSDHIMFRDMASERDRRLQWIEDYLAQHADAALVDPFEKVAKVINRVTMLEHLREAAVRNEAAGGMPRPPRFLVLHENRQGLECEDGVDPRGPGEGSSGSTVAQTSSAAGVIEMPAATSSLVGGVGDLQFPVICKPIEACGTRGSHTMMVVLDEAGMADVPLPIVVQEFHNHGGILYKVCVVGDDVRMFPRVSVPDLRSSGLRGSFTFDSQKPYPSLREVQAISARAGESRRRPRQQPQQQQQPNGIEKHILSSGDQFAVVSANRTPDSCGRGPSVSSGPADLSQGYGRWKASFAREKPDSVADVAIGEEAQKTRKGVVSLGDAKIAATRIKDTFGLSIFGFDLIVDSGTGEVMVIDVNYFPSFKDLPDFPQVLRRRMIEITGQATGGSAMAGTPILQAYTTRQEEQSPV